MLLSLFDLSFQGTSYKTKIDAYSCFSIFKSLGRVSTKLYKFFAIQIQQVTDKILTIDEEFSWITIVSISPGLISICGKIIFESNINLYLKQRSWMKV